jgi:RimJ/RimL family protein N-acetyltransferase
MTPPSPTDTVLLRYVTGSDLRIFFQQQLDPVAAAMDEPIATDWKAFLAYWSGPGSSPGCFTRTILSDGQVAGYLTSYSGLNTREVGYRLGREYWGRGIATRALTIYLHEIEHSRPLGAQTRPENLASQRVLTKCGFRFDGLTSELTRLDNEEPQSVWFVLD